MSLLYLVVVVAVVVVVVVVVDVYSALCNGLLCATCRHHLYHFSIYAECDTRTLKYHPVPSCLQAIFSSV